MDDCVILTCKSDAWQQNTLVQVSEVLAKTSPVGPVEIELRRPKRSLDQNRLLWPLLTDFSQQVEHFGNKYSPDDWKAILTAAYENEIRSAPTLDGRGLVFLGGRTSKYTKAVFSGFIEFIYSEGTERGVEWSQASEDAREEVS